MKFHVERMFAGEVARWRYNRGRNAIFALMLIDSALHDHEVQRARR